jgi:hypothetical protein
MVIVMLRGRVDRRLALHLDRGLVFVMLFQILLSPLIIVGTGDVFTPVSNSLILAQRIPVAWLVQI